MKTDEGRYSNLAESLSELVYRADPETFVATYVNRAVEDLYGYTPDEWLRNPDLWENTIHPEDHKRVLQEFSEGIRKAKNFTCEYRIVRKDKAIRWVQDRVSFEKLEDSTTVSLNGVMYDITEQQKYKEMVESSGTMVFSMDLSGNLIFVNKQWERIIGYAADEIQGTNGFELIHPDDVPFVSKEFSKVTKGETVENIEFRSKTKDGTIKSIMMNAAPIVDPKGNVDSIIGTAVDTTERKQAEEALQGSEEKLRLVFESATEGITVTDLNGNTIDTNEVTVRIHGCDNKHRLIGRNAFELIVERDHARAMENLKKTLAEGHSGILEYTLLREDGSEFPGELSAALLKDQSGNPTGFVAITRDISERKKVEEALRESEEKLRLMFESAAAGIVVTDLNGIIIDANERAAEIRGVDSKDELLGNNPIDYTAPCDREIAALNMRRTIEERLTEVNEYTFLKVDGSEFPGEVSSSVFMDANGNPSGVIAVVRDITERKRADEALRESEERYRSLVEAGERLGEAITMLQDTDTTKAAHVFANKEWSRITGYTAEELKDISYWELIHPRDRDAVADRVQRRLQGESLTGHYEITIISKDGREVPVEVATGSTITFNGKPASVGYIRDITRRKKSEEALRESEDKLRSMFENANDAVVLTDLYGNFIDVNENAIKILGLSSKEEILGKNNLQFVAPDDRDAAAQDMKKMLEQGNVSGVEYSALRKDGSSVPVELNASLIKDSHGNPTFIIGIIRDASERHAFEAERQKAAKLESVGTLAGGIAHDFNNILTGIMGNIGLAMRYVETKSKAFERLEEAEKASIRARDLTQQLLTFSRGGVPIKKAVSVVRLIKESTSFALRGSNIACDFDLPDNLRSVEVDEGQINQVITNIVINAQEAMPEGGVINVNARNIEIEDESTLPLSKGRYVWITIADRGVGIPKKHLDRIFEPYFTTKQKGSGLGLATSYSIVKNHGGHMTVDSAPTVGTAFQIYLPASEESAAVEKEDKAEVITTGEGMILVMDDEEMVRDLLYSELTGVGYDVELARDGAEAIEKYAKAKEAGQPFDAVILDLTIPGGMGGKEAIKKLLEIDPDAKVIVSSGYATDPIMANYKKYGFSAVVSKPYRVADIEKALHGLPRKKK